MADDRRAMPLDLPPMVEQVVSTPSRECASRRLRASHLARQRRLRERGGRSARHRSTGTGRCLPSRSQRTRAPRIGSRSSPRNPGAVAKPIDPGNLVALIAQPWAPHARPTPPDRAGRDEGAVGRDADEKLAGFTGIPFAELALPPGRRDAHRQYR